MDAHEFARFLVYLTCAYFTHIIHLKKSKDAPLALFCGTLEYWQDRCDPLRIVQEPIKYDPTNPRTYFELLMTDESYRKFMFSREWMFPNAAELFDLHKNAFPDLKNVMLDAFEALGWEYVPCLSTSSSFTKYLFRERKDRGSTFYQCARLVWPGRPTPRAPEGMYLPDMCINGRYHPEIASFMRVYSDREGKIIIFKRSCVFFFAVISSTLYSAATPAPSASLFSFSSPFENALPRYKIKLILVYILASFFDYHGTSTAAATFAQLRDECAAAQTRAAQLHSQVAQLQTQLAAAEANVRRLEEEALSAAIESGPSSPVPQGVMNIYTLLYKKMNSLRCGGNYIHIYE